MKIILILANSTDPDGMQCYRIIFFTDHSKAVLLLWILLLFMFHVCHAGMSVHCSLVVTYWERADILVLLYVMFSCVFVTFPCGVLGQVWYLIVLIPDLCLLPSFHCLPKYPLGVSSIQRVNPY